MGSGLYAPLFSVGMNNSTDLQEYIISRRFPQKLSRRILDQYKYHYKRVSVLDNYAILESLPTTARTSLLFAQYHDAVDNVSFLQVNEHHFLLCEEAVACVRRGKCVGYSVARSLRS